MTKMGSRAANEPLAAEFRANLAADVPVPIAGGKNDNDNDDHADVCL